MKNKNAARPRKHPARNEDPTVPPPVLSPFATEPPPQLPNESDGDYGLFREYFRYGATLTLQQIAQRCGSSQASVSRALRRHQWVERTQRALAGQLPDMPPDTAEWAQRREDVRRTEWELHLELVKAGRESLELWRRSGSVPRPGELVRLLELAEKLGRLATGLPLSHTEVTGENGNPIQVEFVAALEKVYGKTSSPVIDVPPEPSAARASEVSRLTVEDLDLLMPMATLHGKGHKIRQCPLWKVPAEALREVVLNRPPNPPRLSPPALCPGAPL